MLGNITKADLETCNVNVRYEASPALDHSIIIDADIHSVGLGFYANECEVQVHSIANTSFVTAKSNSHGCMTVVATHEQLNPAMDFFNGSCMSLGQMAGFK